MDKKAKIELLRANLAEYPDFPKKGILFWDIFSILKEPELFHVLKDVLMETVKEIQPLPECIVALDARGFLFGPILSLELNIPFVPVRKPGKLPGELITSTYTKEYGEDSLALQLNSITNGQRVLIIDDLLATGGTLACAVEMVQKAGGNVIACLALIELEALNGRKLINKDIISLIKI
ncbi:uncharacterized protein LOC126886799 [Diabrotica virgifera virgifera]|uniref:Adenine phosphoribosyltransferase n=1 Tax=Diabrotica virgifera virgifera TaxID=50390 RepID=A0A6P7H4D8_DIAVI|nr:uncharacterized protein LOC126886799 [Diabrotica virgifera virgifera]